MPYVHVETDVWLSPEECGTAIAKNDLDTLLRFVRAAREAVDLLFDYGAAEQATKLFKAGEPIPALFDLGVRWQALKADEAYQKWKTAQAMSAGEELVK